MAGIVATFECQRLFYPVVCRFINTFISLFVFRCISYFCSCFDTVA